MDPTTNLPNGLQTSLISLVGPAYPAAPFTFATLPAASSVPAGTLANTTDQGPFYSNGTVWTNLVGSGNPTYAVTPAETFLGVTPTNLAYPANSIVDPRRYGATVGGSVDCSAAYATAASVAAAGVGRQGCGTWVLVAPGDWKIITGFTLGERVGIIGYGPISRLQYAPTANGTLITCQNGSSICDENVIRDIRLWSADNTYVKIAINLVDCNFPKIDNVLVDGSVNRSGAFYWADPTFGSTALQTNGRQSGGITNYSFYADIPLYIGINPNSNISLDHFNFHNGQYSSKATVSTQGVVTVQDGANLSNISFDGEQSWVGSYNRFYWNDTTSTQVSYGIKISNVRAEQGTNVLGYDFYLHHNTRIQSLVLDNCYFGAKDGTCVSLRKTGTVTLGPGTTLAPATGKAQIDTDNSVWGLELVGVYSDTTGINGITGMNLVRSAGFEPSGAIHPSDAMYVSTALNANVDQVFPSGTRGAGVTVASAAIVLLRLRNCAGHAIVSTNSYATWSGIFQGNGNALTQMGQCPSSGGVAWSMTKNNASTYNIFYDAAGASGAGYYFQNNDAASVRIACLFLGSTIASAF